MKRLYIYIACAVWPFAGHAQTVLTLNECIRLAKENNKSIKASECQLQAAQQDQRSAWANFFPSFSLTGSALYSTADGSYSSGSTGIDLSYKFGWLYGGGAKVEQPVYLGGKIRAGYRMGKIGSDMARQNRRLTESEVVVETSRAYAEAVRAKELREVATSYHTLLTELMRTVESARQHGLKSRNDVLKVQVKLDESELDLRRTGNALRLATMNLCHYTGRPLTDTLETTDALPATDYAATAEVGIYNRPEYHILEQKSELARQNVALSKSERLPQVGLVGQYGYLNGIEFNERKLLDSWNFLVGVQVSVPIFNFGGRTAKTRSAKAQYAQVQAERDNADELLTLEMTQSLNNLDEARLEVRLAESSVESAEENLRTSRLQYDKGMELLSDYLEAQTLWQQAHQTQVKVRIDCYLCWLKYRKATGQIN